MERSRAGRGGGLRRRKSLLISAAIVALVIILIVTEQVAILYLLATLGVAVLLIVVALADLEGVRRRPDDPAPRDDAAAIADGQTRVAPSTGTAATTAPRPRVRRGRA